MHNLSKQKWSRGRVSTTQGTKLHPAIDMYVWPESLSTTGVIVHMNRNKKKRCSTNGDVMAQAVWALTPLLTPLSMVTPYSSVLWKKQITTAILTPFSSRPMKKYQNFKLTLVEVVSLSKPCLQVIYQIHLSYTSPDYVYMGALSLAVHTCSLEHTLHIHQHGEYTRFNRN